MTSSVAGLMHLEQCNRFQSLDEETLNLLDHFFGVHGRNEFIVDEQTSVNTDLFVRARYGNLDGVSHSEVMNY